MKTMKSLKPQILTIVFTLIVLVLGGCEKSIVEDETLPDGRRLTHISNVETKVYYMCVSFVDSDGKDLVAPLKPEGEEEIWYGSVDPWRYSLTIVLPDGGYYNYGSFEIGNYFGRDPEFIEDYGEYDNRFFLMNRYHHSELGSVECFKTIKYRITFPSIFGDNSAHELVTYWEDEPEERSNSRDPQCYKACLDGNEVRVKKAIFDRAISGDYYSYFIDIVLDK